MLPVFHKSATPAACGINDSELAEIGVILNGKRGFCLTSYKSDYIKRRIAIRMRATRCGAAAQYRALLLRREDELDQLQKTLTIHVSQFFRNPSLFDALRHQVLPPLFDTALSRGDKRLRIWCLGCAGGEEPYSLAMLLREHFSRELDRVETVILGTDIDEGTLWAARAAEYEIERLKDVPPRIIKRYFTRQGNRCRLIPDIRDMVDFSRNDITATDQYTASDMVLCRNTLIYFIRTEQERILNGIADILPVNSGVLALGKSETLVGDTRRRYRALCPVERVYRRVA